MVTSTSTGPDAWAGVVTRSVVSETRTRSVAVTVPKRTVVARVRPVPVSVTTVPPLGGPVCGDTDAMTGRGSNAKVLDAAAGDVPYGVVTVRPTSRRCGQAS